MKIIISTFSLLLTFVSMVCAQVPDLVKQKPLTNRVSAAPESVFSMFRNAGMNPVNHTLTVEEKAKLEKATAILPPLHRQILKMHLHSLSFMDSMPNNALTSPIGEDDANKQFNITFRAGILSETISEWATQKEYTAFNKQSDPAFQIMVEGGSLDAIQYILLHEATHVVDAVLNLTPHPADREAVVPPTAFIKGIWQKMNQPANKFTDSLLNLTRQRNGSVSLSLAPAAYEALKKTPFASHYSAAAWFEDLAELVTIYHLTQKMHQPYRIVVKQNNIEVARFEPMRNKLVKKRRKTLTVFYKEAK